MRSAFPVPEPATGFHMLSSGGHLSMLNIRLTMRMVEQSLKLLFYIVCFSVVGWLGSQVVDRRHPVALEMTLMTPQVRPASELRISIKGQRYKVCGVTLTWILFDGINEVRTFVEPARPAVGKPGPIDQFVKGFWVPEYAAPGKARIRLIRSYVCADNYIQEIKPVEWAEPDLNFIIMNKDGSMPDLKNNSVTRQIN